MKRIALADLHYSEYKSDDLIEDTPRRLFELNMTINKCVEYARKHNIKDIDILGDIDNDKNIIYTVPQNMLKKIFESNLDINFNLIAGNHDFSDTTDKPECTISVFNTHKNVKCYIDGIFRIENITIVPFSSNIVNYLKTCCEPNDILLSHFGVSDAVLQSGLSIQTNISFADLTDKFKLILLGHYHKPQALKNDKGMLFYVGNPIHRDWNDKNEKKRFLVYDTKTLEVISEPISWTKEFREFEIDDSNKNNMNEILELAKAEREKGNNVRVRNKVKIENKIFVENNFNIVDDTDADVTQRGVTSSMSQEDKFKSYMKYKEIPEADQAEYLAEIKSMLAQEVNMFSNSKKDAHIKKIKEEAKKQEVIPVQLSPIETHQDFELNL